MTPNNYKYDVAFSFLAEDEPLATELNDLLQDRLRTFLYSKKQGEIAGTDGEKTFGDVFGKEALLVVVLYRQGWGETPWTRIEQTAIRNRAYEEGYDFVKFIPLDDSPAVPRWLPRTQIWIGLKRWGAAGAASIIESRVEELGGEPHEESVQERAARLERSLAFDAKRDKFLNSNEGVDAARDLYATLQGEIERLVGSIRATAPSIQITTKKAEGRMVVIGPQIGLSVNWYYRYCNTLDKSFLEVSIWPGHPPFPGIRHYEEPHAIDTISINFDILPSGDLCWVSQSPKRRVFSTNDLASFMLKYYMDKSCIK